MMENTIKYKSAQAEMIYLSLLHTLKSNNVAFDEKYEKLIHEIDARHNVVDLLDLLSGLYNFISFENDIDLESEDEE